MRIAVGSDHQGVDLRTKVVGLLGRIGQDVVDVGTNVRETENVDYPDIAENVALQVSTSEVERGILICGTGLGMCIAANKLPGVRAAPCHDTLTTEVVRRHNDLNVLCLPGDFIDEELLDQVIRVFLETPFDGGRHTRRLDKIALIESNHGEA